MFQNGNTHGHARNYTLRNKHWPIIQHLERAKMEFQTPPSPSLLLLAARLRISPAWHSRFTELVTEFLATRSAVPWPFFFFSRRYLVLLGFSHQQRGAIDVDRPLDGLAELLPSFFFCSSCRCVRTLLHFSRRLRAVTCGHATPIIGAVTGRRRDATGAQSIREEPPQKCRRPS